MQERNNGIGQFNGNLYILLSETNDGRRTETYNDFAETNNQSEARKKVETRKGYKRKQKALPRKQNTNTSNNTVSGNNKKTR